MKLIDKDALVAEIERRVSYLYPKNGQGMVITKILKEHYKDLKDFINTLEVKKVDLEKEFKQKYEQALGRARVWKEKSGMPVDKQGILDDIFPELKESEDERIRKELVRAFTTTADKREHEIYGNGITYGQVLAWLEKQGEQKSTWSEEDENMLQKAISTIMYALSIPIGKENDPCFVGSSTISWLKSLKERYTWKPNRGQIEAIEDAIKFLGCTKKVREDLKSLYEQLKKLREE